MSVRKGEDRAPTPLELAAYLDGEFEGDDALLPQKQAIAAWLSHHPEAAADLAALRKLKHVWRETTPANPDEDRWSLVLSGIQTELAKPRTPGVPSRQFPWGWVFGAAAALLLVAGALALQWLTNSNDISPSGPLLPNLAKKQPGSGVPAESPPLILPDEPFPIALPEDIEIFHVGGIDMESLPVGNLPLDGPMKLAGPGEVVFTSIQKPPKKNMQPNALDEPPMVWVRSPKD